MPTLPADEEIVVYSIPMRTKFRGITVREGALWRGPAGWTEWSPFNDYDPAESAPWLDAALEAAYDPFPPRLRDSIPVNCTVPAVRPDAALKIVLASGGCRTAKVKVAEPGQSLAADCDRVAAVREALGHTGKIRVDANTNWSVDDAISAIGAIDRAAGGLEYVEQPCKSVAELAQVRRAVTVLIAADESIRRAEDPYLVARAEAADIAVIKVQPLGGIAAALKIAAQIGLPVVVSSALETSIGLQQSLALAAALPQLPYACGLNTIALLNQDAVEQSLIARDGAIAVPTRRIAPDRLAQITADPPTRERWLARIHDVAS
ncbi:MAG: o-succinylbenzoate synthase [Antricoccus sp.]